MDGRDFDALARRLAGGSTRRGVLRTGLALTGAALGLGGLAGADAAVRKRLAGRPCREDSQCRSGVCGPAGARRKVCQCVSAGDCPTPKSRCEIATCDQAGQCATVARSCDDNNVCTVDTCDPKVGCVHTPISCDDNDACTVDTCDPQLGCVHTPLDCDDHNACTVDTCDSQLGCIHTPVVCDDNNACTTDSCDPQRGCIHTPINCDDGDPCTVDTCDPALGCQHTHSACGLVSDGNGGTVCCGGCGPTANCFDFICQAPPPCECAFGGLPTANLAGGGTLYVSGGLICISPCTSQADCGCDQVCMESYTSCQRGMPLATCESEFGKPPGAYCAAIKVCQPPV